MMHSIAFNDDSYHTNKDVDGDFVLVPPASAPPADPIAELNEGLHDDDDDDDSSYDYCDDVFERPLSVQLGKLESVDEDDNLSFSGPQAMDEDEEEVLLEMAMSSSIMNQLSRDMDELQGQTDHDHTSTRSGGPSGEWNESQEQGADSKSMLAEESAATNSGWTGSNTSELFVSTDIEVHDAFPKTTTTTKKTTVSRLTNKKRRKQLKLSKKAAAAAAAAAALTKMSMNTHPVSPIRRNNNKKIAPGPQPPSRKVMHSQVACATQEIANFRDGMQHNTMSKMVR